MNFNRAIMVTRLINYSWAESTRFTIQGSPTLTAAKKYITLKQKKKTAVGATTVFGFVQNGHWVNWL